MAVLANATASDLPKEPSTKYILDPIPGATPEVYVKTGLGLLQYGNQMDALPSDGSLTKIIRDGDKIYLGNVYSWYSTPGWIEGTLDGNKATFKLPQLVNQYDEDVNGIMTRRQYYAVVCDMVVRQGNADMVPTEEQLFSLTLNDDGSIVPDKLPNDKDAWLCNWSYESRTWDWTMDADLYDVLNKQEAKTINVPADVEFTPMVLTYPHILYGGAYANKVEVGFKDNDCYIKGMAIGIKDLEEAVIKGEKNGKVISFDSNQFLGNSWLFGFTQYFIAGETEFVEDSSMGYRPLFSQMDGLEFVYDEAAGTLTSDMSFIIVPAIQEDDENLYYENIYNTPEIYTIDPDAIIKNLVAPEVKAYDAPADGYPHIIDFVGSMMSADNQMLDMSKLYFQFLIDGVPFEFTPAMDPALKTATSLIPFNSDDKYCFVAYEQIYQLVAIPASVTFKTLTLRFVYDPEGENPVYSASVYVAGDKSEVDNLLNDDDTIATYYDLHGRKISKPGKGIFVKFTNKIDGSVSASKVIVK